MRSSSSLYWFFSLALPVLIAACAVPAFCKEVALPTTIRVQLDSSAKLKPGASVQAHTVEPLYLADRLVVPAGSVITGHVVQVAAVSRRERLNAISHGDFTPLKIAKIQFDELELRGGEDVAIKTAPAEQGSEILHFHRTTGTPPSLFHRAWARVVGQEHQTVGLVTAPGRMERMKRFFYSQMPWHPQGIAADSEYDVTLLDVPADLGPPDLKIENPKPGHDQSRLKHDAVLHARLQNELNSKTAKPGDLVLATVTQPLYDAQGQIEVPEGAVLRGRVLQGKHAKHWGRNGALRFSFRQVEFPQGFEQSVTGVPTGVDGSRQQNLKLDSEGGVTPDTNKGFAAPLALGLLATHSLADEDASMAGSATASNGFGLIMRIVAVASNSQNFSGIVGMITAGRSVYSRFVARGHDVVFPRNSEVEIEVGPLRAKPLPSLRP